MKEANCQAHLFKGGGGWKQVMAHLVALLVK